MNAGARTDVLTAEQRHLNMSRIRGKDTKPELQLRRLLHAAGRIWSSHNTGPWSSCTAASSTGTTAHCSTGRRSREDFWRTKLNRNVERDHQTEARLHEAGWRVLTVWECALRGKLRLPDAEVAEQTRRWLRSGAVTGEVACRGVPMGDPAASL
ncbi:hypothetical protein [Deinococcus aquaticus]|uniref:hypothetical protein n=1 Tax=Deinococcus aquaticus TaxID=328692 RepID=UPI0030A6E832